MLERVPEGWAPNAPIDAVPGPAFGRALRAGPADEVRARADFGPLPPARKRA